MSELNPGLLDREITIQVATRTQDDETGEEVIAWADDQTLYAQWMPGNSREAYFAGQRLAAHVDGVFRVPPIDRPNPTTQRIVFDDRTFDMKPPIEIGRGGGWEIPVVARADS